MLTKNDRLLLAEKNIPEAQFNEQLARFTHGFPYPEITAPAAAGKGVRIIPKDQCAALIDRWDASLAGGAKALKFVPASGAASRMFKDLYAFLAGGNESPSTDAEKRFFDGIARFAFYEALNRQCREKTGHDIPSLMALGRYKTIASTLLEADGGGGLGYGLLPKGLLLFHAAPQGMRTAIEEHLVEGALYARNRTGEVWLHLTVLPEHQALFEQLLREKCAAYEALYGVKYHITFSIQDPATDTVAADMQNRPFRQADGALLFRPGGHGALIGNLNRLDADVIFIKNIDNVAPDHLKGITVEYKKILAGVLVSLQEQLFRYVRLIESGNYTHSQVEEMIHFLQDDLCIRNPEIKWLEDAELILYMKRKFLRPLRVCGMVRNAGEPGGGPFFVVNPDGTLSLQILESTQIDMNCPAKKALFEASTYFNPVDLVCAVKDPEGKKYNLTDFVDANTGFISRKSKDGCELQALELPGLWNGAMSDWNTVFVEVPAETFNPVKTVNDLLRPQHQ
jgi:hypothetical protein